MRLPYYKYRWRREFDPPSFQKVPKMMEIDGGLADDQIKSPWAGQGLEELLRRNVAFGQS